MGHDDTPTVSLAFDDRVRVAGEIVEGEVEVYFPALLEDDIAEVYVKLRGTIQTEVTRNRGKEHSVRFGEVDLVSETVQLWQKGSPVYPAQGSQTLRLPFRFTLPQSLPPSFQDSGFDWHGTVGYAIEAVGERPGLHFNRKAHLAFPVIPHNGQGAALRSTLSGGWAGPWKTLQQKGEIRRGLWGDYSNVLVNLFIPEIEAFPTMTPIPFHLNVVTITKLMKHDEVEDGDSIFPPTPLLQKDLEFKLERKVDVKALNYSASSSSHFVAHLGGMAEEKDNTFYKDVQVLPTEKVWIPSQDPHEAHKHKGQWRQEVTFKSSFTLTCPPAFQTEILSVRYRAKLKVKFPGIGNDLEIEMPMNVISSAPPPGAQGWTIPTPQLDLPSSYFAADGWQSRTS